MDKYEYQVCADQIKLLISEKRFAEAMAIADTIDWRRVKSVSMLCTVSEIYKINKCYTESMEILLLAYDRYPNGRTIVYALCELAIKLNDIVRAVEYYKEFVQLAPDDTSNYILLYKIYELQEVSIEERIEVLEEFKKRDYREKWAYELALLYHKIGQETRCIQECDELILWFGDGKFVKKAMELKMQHTGLSREQQLKYEGRQEPMTDQFMSMQQPVQQIYDTDPQAGNPQQIPINPYMQPGPMQGMAYMNPNMTPYPTEQDMYQQQMNVQPVENQAVGQTAQMLSTSEIDSIEVRPVNVGMYSTMDLQNGLSENIKKFFEKEETEAEDNSVTYSVDPQAYNKLYENDTMDVINEESGPVFKTGNFDTDENEQDDEKDDSDEEDMQITQYIPPAPKEIKEILPVEEEKEEANVNEDEKASNSVIVEEEQTEDVQADSIDEAEKPKNSNSEAKINYFGDNSQLARMEEKSAIELEEELIRAHDAVSINNNQKPKLDEIPATKIGKKYDEMLMQEYDGQISMSIQKTPEIEKQITGQMNFDDLYISWEERRRENELRRIQEAKQRSLVQTSDIMAQLKGVLPEIDDIAKPTPPKPLPPIDFSSLPHSKPVISTESFNLSDDLEEEEKMTDDAIDRAVEEAISKHEKNASYYSQEAEEALEGEAVDSENPVEEAEVTPDYKQDSVGEEINNVYEPIEESITEELTIEDTNIEDSDSKDTDVEDSIIKDSIIEEEEMAEAVSTIINEESPKEDNDIQIAETEAPKEEQVDKEPELEFDEITYTEDIAVETPIDESFINDSISDEEDLLSDPTEEIVVSEDILKDNVEEINDVEGEVVSDEEPKDSEDDVLPEIQFDFEPYKKEPELVEEQGEVEESLEEAATDTVEKDEAYETQKDYSENAQEEEFTDDSTEDFLEENLKTDSDLELTYSEDEEAANRAAMEVTSELPRYPYEEIDDYGEVDEIETIDQPEEIEDYSHTSDIPIDEIAKANYEAGIEEEYSMDYESIEDVQDTRKHPSYMKITKSPMSRRDFDKEELRIFSRFNGIEWIKAQIVNAIDEMSMDPATGNVIITGPDALGRRNLAVDVVKVMQALDNDFKGKVAKISGEALNKKDIPLTIKKLHHGALIVENAGGLNESSAKILSEALELESSPILVVLEGDDDSINNLLLSSRDLIDRVFSARIELQEFTTDDLVAYGKSYANELEYSIDEMGVLALYTKIGSLQTLEHSATLEEVREIVDNAIKHVDKKNMSHFVDVLFAKRYDDDDYIILREKDFVL